MHAAPQMINLSQSTTRYFMTPKPIAFSGTLPDALLTEAQAAAILNVAPATLTAWRATKRAARPVHCKVGGAVRYRRTDIDRFISESIHQ